MLAAIIAVAWGAIQLVDRLRGDEPPPPPVATPETTPTTPAPTPPPDQISVALETSATPCEPANVRIVPSVAGGQFAGGPVRVDLMIATLDGQACTFAPTADQLLVVVEADRAPVYDSSVCRAAFFAEPVAVPEGWGTVAAVEWTGRGSGAACSPREGFAPAGGYTLKIGTYGGEPGETSFRLQRREPETPETPATPTPTPTPAPSAEAE